MEEIKIQDGQINSEAQISIADIIQRIGDMGLGL